MFNEFSTRFLLDKVKLTPINPRKLEYGVNLQANGVAFIYIEVTLETRVQKPRSMENKLILMPVDKKRNNKKNVIWQWL